MIYRSLQILSFLCLIAGCSPSEQQTVWTYDVVFRESPAGEFTKERVGNDQFEYHYHYTDRGRGPDYKEVIRRDDEGWIVQQTISGVNYRKSEIEEFFNLKEGIADWKNAKEQRKEAYLEESLYFRYDGSPAAYEILAQQLIQSPEVSLYPEGTASLVNNQSIVLSNGLAVELMMISGLGLNPTFVWMMEGEMIAQISGNLHVVRKDLIAQRTELKNLQNKAEDDYLNDIANQLSETVGEMVIRNVDVFQTAGTLMRNQDVHISGNLIQAIYPSGSKEVAKGAVVIEGTGKSLLPGLFDMHTHNTKFRGILHLAGGITSVRDLANNKQLKQLSQQFDNDQILGPRILTFCGIIDGSGPFANQRNVVETLEEGLAEIQSYKDLEYQQIKLYSSIRPEWVEPMVQRAHDLGMRVSGHIPAYMTASQAIAKGYDEIQHINMLFLNFLPDTIDTRTPLRFTMPARYGRDLDLKSSMYLEFVRQLKDNDILVDPTVGIFENMFIAERGELSPTYAAIADRMPLMSQRGFYAGGWPKKDEDLLRYSESFQKMLDVIADLHHRGVKLVPGTDGLPGFLYHRELELYVQAGIPTHEVLKMATINSAEIIGVADQLGSIEPGKLADVILVDGDPVEDISDIRRVEWTIKNGRKYNAEALYASQGIKHFK